MLLEDNM
jgi:Co/Zn/Cd efflux system component